uniref:hypothetical protein n=1 Tax=uncultured Bacteroides sp. TaxID=162156 RepID=UPI0025F3BA31|nr:hypothetical protein [uncultured Bacteroides sp.]
MNQIYTFPLPLKNIHCVAREDDYAYRLCRNNNLHIVGLNITTPRTKLIYNLCSGSTLYIEKGFVLISVF